MKSNLSKYLISALALIFAGIFTVSCINDSNDEPAPAPDTDPEPSMIRFSVADVKSRIIYDGEDYEKSAFEPGDTVGCFLRTRTNNFVPSSFRAYLFVVNSRNFLELRKVYDRRGGATQGTFINIEDANLSDEGEHYLIRYNQHDPASGVADEYLYLNGKEQSYGFVFYYPAVSKELLAGDYQQARAKYDGTVPFYKLLEFPHASRQEELPESENPCPFMPNWSFGAGFNATMRTNDASEWNDDTWSKADPAEYPVFASSCQIDKTKVQNSDFLYAYCLKDNGGNNITTNTSGTINVQLEKAFAAIELVCTDGYEATNVTFEGNPIVLGKRFNFKETVKDNYSEWETPPAFLYDWTDRTGARQYTEFTGRILPWERVEKKRFRVVLPPQTVNEDMVINVTVNGQPHRIYIREVMRKNGVTDYKFESNKYYIIRFSPKYIEFIIRDWLDGPTTELDPIKPQN